LPLLSLPSHSKSCVPFGISSILRLFTILLSLSLTSKVPVFTSLLKYISNWSASPFVCCILLSLSEAVLPIAEITLYCCELAKDSPSFSSVLRVFSADSSEASSDVC